MTHFRITEIPRLLGIAWPHLNSLNIFNFFIKKTFLATLPVTVRQELPVPHSIPLTLHTWHIWTVFWTSVPDTARKFVQNEEFHSGSIVAILLTTWSWAFVVVSMSQMTNDQTQSTLQSNVKSPWLWEGTPWRFNPHATALLQGFVFVRCGDWSPLSNVGESKLKFNFLEHFSSCPDSLVNKFTLCFNYLRSALLKGVVSCWSFVQLGHGETWVFKFVLDFLSNLLFFLQVLVYLQIIKISSTLHTFYISQKRLLQMFALRKKNPKL